MTSNYKLIKKYNLKSLYKYWNKIDSDCEESAEAKSWEHVHTDVYGEDFAISVFKCTDDIKSTDEDGFERFYRVVFFNLHDEGEPVMREFFRHGKNLRVKGIAFSGNVLYVKEIGGNDSKVNFRTFNIIDMQGNNVVIMKKSRLVLPIVQNNYISFYLCPRDSYVGPSHLFEINLGEMAKFFNYKYKFVKGRDFDDKYKYICSDIGRNSAYATSGQHKSKPKQGEESGLEKLNKMIGLDKIKTQIKEILAYKKLQEELEKSGKKSKNLCYNMFFTGNPGTAKTSVARIIAQIFKENGIVSNNIFKEVGRADLIGEYIGQTAPKVKKVFKNAKGGVLFIDEAYSLYEDHCEYGDEAIATMIQEMENMKGEIVVIFAGYPDEMKKFIDKNPGLESRVPFKFDFNDYSADELIEIIKLQVEENQFRVTDEALSRLETYCETARKQRNFGNGRFCRNLVEQAVLRYSVRKAEEKKPVYDFILGSEDFVLEEIQASAEPKKRTIGFQTGMKKEAPSRAS